MAGAGGCAGWVGGGVGPALGAGGGERNRLLSKSRSVSRNDFCGWLMTTSQGESEIASIVMQMKQKCNRFSNLLLQIPIRLPYIEASESGQIVGDVVLARAAADLIARLHAAISGLEQEPFGRLHIAAQSRCRLPQERDRARDMRRRHRSAAHHAIAPVRQTG